MSRPPDEIRSQAVLVIARPLASDDEAGVLEKELARLGQATPRPWWEPLSDDPRERLLRRLDALDTTPTLPTIPVQDGFDKTAAAILSWLRNNPAPVRQAEQPEPVWHGSLLLVVAVPVGDSGTVALGDLRELGERVSSRGISVRMVLLVVSTRALAHPGRLVEQVERQRSGLNEQGTVLEGAVVVQGVTGAGAIGLPELAAEAHLVAYYLSLLPIAVRTDHVLARRRIRLASARRWADPRLVTLHLATRRLAVATSEAILADELPADDDGAPSVVEQSVLEDAAARLSAGRLQAELIDVHSPMARGLTGPLMPDAKLSLDTRVAAIDGLLQVHRQVEASPDGLQARLDRAIGETVNMVTDWLASVVADELVASPGRWRRAEEILDAVDTLPRNATDPGDPPRLGWGDDAGQRLRELAPERAPAIAALVLGLIFGVGVFAPLQQILLSASGMTPLEALTGGIVGSALAASVPLSVYFGTRVLRHGRQRRYLRSLQLAVSRWIDGMFTWAGRAGPFRLRGAVAAVRGRVAAARESWRAARRALAEAESQAREYWLERTLFLSPLDSRTIAQAVDTLTDEADARACADAVFEEIAARRGRDATPTAVLDTLPTDNERVCFTQAREALLLLLDDTNDDLLGVDPLTIWPRLMQSIEQDAYRLGLRPRAFLFAPDVLAIQARAGTNVVRCVDAADEERGTLMVAWSRLEADDVLSDSDDLLVPALRGIG